MHSIDYFIFLLYFSAVMGVGVYFYRRNTDREDYYVGGRNISATHIGLSIVATDVGGGFSIGLGGLGFIMGVSGSWLLFTGLIGAWAAAVLIVPKIKILDTKYSFLTFPDFLRHRFDKRVALLAALISGIGYLGFTGAQILAGAKLAAGSVFSEVTWISPLDLSLYIMAGVILIYTALGGIKAVIYTDTLQWIILLGGLLFCGVPYAVHSVGGWTALRGALPAEYFSLTNLTLVQFINWFFTIVPIWFLAMTLYQRIYASRSVKDAQKAFFIAGLLEYPTMAFLGVFLGMVARLHFPTAEAEMGMPLLLKEILPVGISGIVLASYFSAIMSTADSCLIASSGNFVNDIIERYRGRIIPPKKIIVLSQILTFLLGGIALVVARNFETVLEIILHAYSFMVAGLLFPTIVGYFFKNRNSVAAIISMFSGGGLAILLIFAGFELPYGLDPCIYGIGFSVLAYYVTAFLYPGTDNRVKPGRDLSRVTRS